MLLELQLLDLLQAELKAEKSKLLEEVEIALQQVKALEGIRKAHDFQHDALQRQILELSAVSDDKATIGKYLQYDFFGNF